MKDAAIAGGVPCSSPSRAALAPAHYMPVGDTPWLEYVT